ncbi:hypothetical protein CHARACLAT_019427 [Characodon lateralis]|uniref:Uncharacterized protein n=1 Tax=Characodon lateralis TaxID=208331 RepID=A0ABU7EV43_9TELE|nr:hypothetical protein [Characodon lateralis]
MEIPAIDIQRPPRAQVPQENHRRDYRNHLREEQGRVPGEPASGHSAEVGSWSNPRPNLTQKQAHTVTITHSSPHAYTLKHSHPSTQRKDKQWMSYTHSHSPYILYTPRSRC